MISKSEQEDQVDMIVRQTCLLGSIYRKQKKISEYLEDQEKMQFFISKHAGAGAIVAVFIENMGSPALPGFLIV